MNKKGKKIGVWGQYGDGGPIADGQAVRTTITTQELIKKYGESEVHILNTNAWRKHPIKFFFSTVNLLKKCKNVIILPADNGLKMIVQIYNLFNKVYQRKLFYIVIGGFLPEFLRKNPLYVKMLNKYQKLFVQTPNLKKDLSELGVQHIDLMTNFKMQSIRKVEDIQLNKDENIKLCILSRLTKDKGIEDAIEAVQIVNATLGGPKVQLDLYGIVPEQYKERFNEIVKDINELSENLGLQDVVIIPVSATEGDNVTVKSENMPWYTGKTLLDHLETVDVTETESEAGFYMPVQRVCRPNHEFRGFQGQIESGKIKVGQTITTLPSNETATVKSLLNGSTSVEEAVTGQAVTIQLDKEVDVSRGCVLTDQARLSVAKSFTATLLWMDDSKLTLGKEYLVKLGTKRIPGFIRSIKYKIDVNTGEHISADHIEKNEIALCEIELAEKIVLDEFKKHKTLGEMILIDRVSHMTSACGVLETVENDGEKPYFQKDDIKVGGYVFEEFYFNLENAMMSKAGSDKKTYHVGDEVPAVGDSFKYPEYFDILSVEDGAAVLIRDGKVEDIQKIEDYRYVGLPVVDERGMALLVKSRADLEKFLAEEKEVTVEKRSEVHNKWFRFETYRKVVCTDNFWVI